MGFLFYSMIPLTTGPDDPSNLTVCFLELLRVPLTSPKFTFVIPVIKGLSRHKKSPSEWGNSELFCENWLNCVKLSLTVIEMEQI